MPQQEATGMKKYVSRYLFCVMLLFAFILVSSAFAELKKVEEGELARANASITGAPIPDQSVDVGKDAALPETIKTFDKAEPVVAPAASNITDSTSVMLNITGQETFRFILNGNHSITTGGITSVQSR